MIPCVLSLENLFGIGGSSKTVTKNPLKKITVPSLSSWNLSKAAPTGQFKATPDKKYLTRNQIPSNNKEANLLKRQSGGKRSNMRLPLFAFLSLILLLSTNDVCAQSPKERTYLQALLGYYSPSDAWSKYSESKNEMKQDPGYSKLEFLQLPIEKIDSLTRESLAIRDQYRRYKAASKKLNLPLIDEKNFCESQARGKDIVERTEHASLIWHQYKEQMSKNNKQYEEPRMFVEHDITKQKQLLADAKGTQRSWTQALSSYYSADQGWDEYSNCRSNLGFSIDYTRYEFTHLPIKEIDAIARAAKREHDIYRRYEVAMDAMGLDTEPPAFFLGNKDADAITSNLEDASSKWCIYKTNMIAMGEDFLSSKDFLNLTPEKRKDLFNLSKGSQRTTYQILTQHYSAKSGWKSYRDSLTAIGIAVPFSESVFKNKSIEEIDQLTRHAVLSKKLYEDFYDLCKSAHLPQKYRATDIYEHLDISKLSQEYQVLREKWSARIVYSESCNRVGVSPNWLIFERKGEQEKAEVAALSNIASENFLEYSSLCKKLDLNPDPAFLSQPLTSQRSQINNLSNTLWDQRKETVTLYAKRTALVVATALVLYKAHEYSKSQQEPTQIASQKDGTPRPSQIDRNAFAKQRDAYWKSEAASNPNKYKSDPSNVKRMLSGRAPIGRDGFPMELHHPGGDPKGILIPMTRTEHRLGDNYLKNHSWMFENKP